MINTQSKVQANILKMIGAFSNVPHFSPIPFFSFPGSLREKIAQRKWFKLPLYRDPIITRSHAKKMSTNGPSPIKENIYEIALLKK